MDLQNENAGKIDTTWIIGSELLKNKLDFDFTEVTWKVGSDSSVADNCPRHESVIESIQNNMKSISWLQDTLFRLKCNVWDKPVSQSLNCIKWLPTELKDYSIRMKNPENQCVTYKIAMSDDGVSCWLN